MRLEANAGRFTVMQNCRQPVGSRRVTVVFKE